MYLRIYNNWITYIIVFVYNVYSIYIPEDAL